MQTAVRRISSYSPASSSSSSERVFIGLPSTLLQTNSSSQGKSFAASIHSSSCKPHKEKKISKEERRALVESFVNKYRAQNVGKFPSFTQVHKEDESSVPLKLVIEVDSSQTPPGDPVGFQTEISTIDFSQDTPNHKAVEHARDDTTLGTDVEDLQPIEHNRSSNHADSLRATNWWGSLISLADGIFSIWWKK